LLGIHDVPKPVDAADQVLLWKLVVICMFLFPSCPYSLHHFLWVDSVILFSWQRLSISRAHSSVGNLSFILYGRTCCETWGVESNSILPCSMWNFSHLKSIAFYSLPFMHVMLKFFNFQGNNDKDDDEVWTYSQFTI
jgi:hypothetical protein